MLSCPHASLTRSWQQGQVTPADSGTGECSLPKQQQQGVVDRRISFPLDISSIKTPFDRMVFRERLGRRKNNQNTDRCLSFLVSHFTCVSLVGEGLSVTMKEGSAKETHVHSGAGGGFAAPGTGHKEHGRHSGGLEASEPRVVIPIMGRGRGANGNLSCSAYQRGISSAFSRLFHAS